MKLFKLIHHQRSSYPEDLLLSPKEHPNLNKGDIVEIFHPEDEGCRLLLQVTLTTKEDLKGRDSLISVEQNIANSFNLRIYNDVYMRVVDPQSVALDSVEITFKDQYMGRSEMWRLKQFLTNTCVYMNKKIEYCEGSIRCQVFEMWSQGDRVACGVINEDTKVVFRSSTSMVYLFIQMSSEMWDFDIHGDLYFEKAVNGFLTDLFMKWKKLASNHEVTIVLFSRTFYSAKSLDEFPVFMRDCLQMDYKGRFYEDFYRVAIQNERNDDWSTILVQLRRLFTAYQGLVLKYHERPGVTIPTAINSTAAQGNFLEVLNISLNVFEKHYLDRSFDRTGQLSVVITPGVGVFEVDRELTNITKQRIIDNGVGSDLVCVGEQPLHAVPLLKFHYKDSSFTSVDDYSMPHWINLSFYSTNKKVAYSTFIPRIKLPPLIKKQNENREIDEEQAKKLKEEEKVNFYADTNPEYIHNSLFDYDAYDDQIFQLPNHGTCSLQRLPRTKKSSVPSLDGFGNFSTSVSSTKDWDFAFVKGHRRKMSDPDIHHSSSNIFSNISECGSPNLKESHSQSLLSPGKQKRHKTSTPMIRTGRALINPFDPSHVTIKLTSNRRRWSHIFPKGPTGVLIQQHHYQAIPSTQATDNQKNANNTFAMTNSEDYSHTAMCQYNRRQIALHKSIERSEDDFNKLSITNTPNERIGYLNEQYFGPKRKISVLNSTFVGSSNQATPQKTKTLLWGATGEQEWEPAIVTAGKIIIGVDWKSLTIPACLPITTDYFPDKRSLNNDYLVSDYTLLPDDVNSEFMRHRAVFRKPLSTVEVFKELVSQRLAQGFQLIVLPDQQLPPAQAPCCGGVPRISRTSISIMLPPPDEERTKEYLLSIGRIFHKISLTGSEIKVTRYRPRHPYPPINIDYRYRFHAPNHDTYEVSGVNFTTEKLENFNWNYMDQYISTRGDTDFQLMEQMKFWRYRMYLLPKEDPTMKRIMDENLQYCDIYVKDTSNASYKQQVEDFLRFVEMHLNKIKRIKKPRGSPTTQPQSHLTKRRHSTSTSIQSRPPAVNNQGQNSPFRDRVGSNRFPERLRPSSNICSNRSGSKIETRSTMAAVQASLAERNLNGSEDNDDCFLVEPPKFKPTTPVEDIFEAFKNPNHGVGFLEPLPSMPSYAFVSYDAIMWLHNRLEGNVNPIQILENMRSKHLICHASGDFGMPIVPGFYLYYIVKQDHESADYKAPLGDLEAFENEWMEVEIPMRFVIFNPSPALSSAPQITESDVPNFLQDDIDKKNLDGRLYKQSHLEIDLSAKSDRTEWGHARYHRQMIPGNSFELNVQWITASGPIVYDLIYGWIRKAPPCGYQLMSIPADPLAEPFLEKSDPLRSPIFVSLNIDSLMQNRSHLFEDFRKDTWPDRMLMFQDAIVRRFGFISCACETKTGSNDISVDTNYVHVTGNMFILVPSPCHGIRSSMRRLGIGSNGNGSSPTNGSLPSQRKLKNYYQIQQKENYITRHVNTNNPTLPKDSPEKGMHNGNRDSNNTNKLGFLWQWNHMISNKKWKSLVINSSDEIFQLRMLRDFKDFCSNSEGRLLKFWDDCWEKKERLSLIK